MVKMNVHVRWQTQIVHSNEKLAKEQRNYVVRLEGNFYTQPKKKESRENGSPNKEYA